MFPLHFTMTRCFRRLISARLFLISAARLRRRFPLSHFRDELFIAAVRAAHYLARIALAYWPRDTARPLYLTSFTFESDDAVTTYRCRRRRLRRYARTRRKSNAADEALYDGGRFSRRGALRHSKPSFRHRFRRLCGGDIG